ncbi:probable LRR receptor-like serine/threonine-protein kinase At5g59680 [Macadamia integrifolia]|uniref:probable LRR receptor-like serine/threonine-protein kinase At5g59680 n=1 Tax=Macadamia integrifolia TaxID=60698 RepID=UPI001C4FDEF7|nr:probable LRR receptor-like serine/threonine-protein kinase At5g59680 [Macadamia integrifolia]
MSLSIFLLWLVSIPLCHIHALPAPRGFLLNCGSSKEINVGSLRWITDEGFITGGHKTTVDTPGLLLVLSTLRFFPDKNVRKNCYVIPVIKGAKYMVRTTYYYGGFDGGNEPPVFDQIIEGMKWSTVNTTEDYAQGLSSYYEIIVAAHGKTLSICLARNNDTVSSPFISTLELENLEDSMYNSTDFVNYALSTVARSSFGYTGGMISFPDDLYNRYWQEFTDESNPIVLCHSNVTSSDFWNIPPTKAFWSAITTSRGKTLKVQWPNVSLPKTNYYIAFYFQDSRTPSPFSWRIFNVSINGKKFYTDLNVTAAGVSVFASDWPLLGLTEITMTPQLGMPVGPIINAGEIFQLIPLGGRTVRRDVMAMDEVARNMNNPPPDWYGDPCLPSENSWTGVTCHTNEKLARVLKLNLTDAGLSGTLSPSLGNLTRLTHIWLGGNKFTGQIPDLSPLNELVSLRLDNNQLEGRIPKSLGELDSLQELFLQNNNLKGQVPNALKTKSGINIQL